MLLTMTISSLRAEMGAGRTPSEQAPTGGCGPAPGSAASHPDPSNLHSATSQWQPRFIRCACPNSLALWLWLAPEAMTCLFRSAKTKHRKQPQE